MAVDDSLPMDQTSFIQVDKNDENAETQQPGVVYDHESMAEASGDSASVHSAISTLGELELPTTAASPGAKPSHGPSGPSRKSDFGFPVRQMTWNTSRRKRTALLQRQKSRDKYGVPNKSSLAPVSEPASVSVKTTPAPMPPKGPTSDVRRSSRIDPESLGGDLVMFAL